MKIVLLVYFFGGEISSDGNAGKDESVESLDESVEVVDDCVEAATKNRNYVIIFSIFTHNLLPIYSDCILLHLLISP